MTKNKAKKSRKNKYYVRRILFFLLLIVLCFFLFRHFFTPEHPDTFPFRLFGEHKLINFKQNEIQIAEEMNRTKWDPSLFKIDINGHMSYNDPDVETALGIDVSSFQKEIDWNEVRSSGFEFTFIRIGYRGTTEGGLFSDSYFESNYTGAKSAGLAVGIYFFSQAITPEEAVEEAEYAVSILNGRALDLPIVFDWEYVSTTARTGGIDSETLSQCADAFCRTVEEHGYSSMVYFNLYTSYLIYDMDTFGEKAIWLAQFAHEPTYFYHYEIWQYSCTGKVPGIDTDVDLDIALDPDIVSKIRTADQSDQAP